MFHCPRCGIIEKKREDIYAHFESDPPCIPKYINVSYDQLRDTYDIYCETFEEMVAQEHGYLREGLPIRVILEMVSNMKTFMIIQDTDDQLNHAELRWVLDIAFSGSCRKIYDNYDDVMEKLVPEGTEVDDPRRDLEVVPPKEGGYMDPPPETPGWTGPFPIPDDMLHRMFEVAAERRAIADAAAIIANDTDAEPEVVAERKEIAGAAELAAVAAELAVEAAKGAVAVAATMDIPNN